MEKIAAQATESPKTVIRHKYHDMWKLPKLKIPRLPKQTGPFPAREWRAHIALISSIFGSMAFTFFAAGLVYIVWKGGWTPETSEMRIEILGQALLLALAGSLVVLVSLGFAINRRMVKITKDGLEASGGDGPFHGEPTEPELDIDSLDYHNGRDEEVEEPEPVVAPVRRGRTPKN